MILPVGLLTCVVCLGGVTASAFERFRMLGEEAVVEEPPVAAEPAPVEEGKFDAAQKGCESSTLPCRPRLWGWNRTCCEPVCGVETKGGAVCQKDCGPVSQKGCESITLPCRPRLWGWNRTCCEPACGVETKGGAACQKDCGPVSQKGCESITLPCRPRLWGWNRTCCEPACGVETKGGAACQKDCGPVSQKGCNGAEQKGFDEGKDSEVQKQAQK